MHQAEARAGHHLLGGAWQVPCGVSHERACRADVYESCGGRAGGQRGEETEAGRVERRRVCLCEEDEEGEVRWTEVSYAGVSGEVWVMGFHGRHQIKLKRMTGE